MPLIINPKDVRSILGDYRKRKISMPCFCAENTFTMEGILKGAAQDTAKASGKDVVNLRGGHGKLSRQAAIEKLYIFGHSTEEGFSGVS